MIKYLTFFVFLILGSSGCSSDDAEDKTTIFEGIIVYEDDLSPVTGAMLNVQGRKRVSGIGQLDEILFERDVTLSSIGGFRFELETTSASINYFAVGLYIEENPVGIDCVPNSCASLKTRTTISDMRFVAKRE